MNRACRVLALLGLFAAAYARAGMDVTWTFVNFTSDPQSVKAVKVTPLAPWGTNSAGIVTGDYKQRQTLNTGAVTITNMTAGYAYRVTFTGSFVETAFTNYFPPGLTGAVNATDYLTPTNPAAFIPYSVSQADAKFQVKSNANFTGTLTWNGIPLSTNAGTSSSGGTIVSSNDNTIIIVPAEIAPGVTNFGVAGNTTVLATDADVLDATNKIRAEYKSDIFPVSTMASNNAAAIGTNYVRIYNSIASDGFFGLGAGGAYTNFNGDANNVLSNYSGIFGYTSQFVLCDRSNSVVGHYSGVPWGDFDVAYCVNPATIPGFSNLATTTSLSNATNIEAAARIAGDAAIGVGLLQTVSSTTNTSLLLFWGANTSAVDRIVLTWNPIMQAYTNTPAAARRAAFLSPDNGHGVLTNLSGLLCSNTIAGFTGFQTWSNLSFPSNVNFTAEYPLQLATNSSVGAVADTNNFGYFGYGFFEPRNFGDTNETRDAYPVLVSDTADTYSAAVGPSPVHGVSGTMRDVCLTPKIGGFYGMFYTTNFAAGVGSGSGAVGLKISTSLMPASWIDYTNLSFLPTNITGVNPTNMRTWGAKPELCGDVLWVTAAVSTNNGDSFVQYTRTIPTNAWPFGSFTEPVAWNQLQYTNMIDGTLRWNKTNVSFVVKEEGTGFAVFGYFLTTNPASPIAFTTTSDTQNWNGAFEGFHWFDFVSNGVPYVGVSGLRYLGPNYGNFGNAFVRLIGVSSNYKSTAPSTWSLLRTVLNPQSPQGGYLQNMVPIKLRSIEERNEAQLAFNSMNANVGATYLFPDKPNTNNLSKFGWWYTQNQGLPIPGQEAGIGLGLNGQKYFVLNSAMDTEIRAQTTDGTTNRAISLNTNRVVISVNVTNAGFVNTAGPTTNFGTAYYRGNIGAQGAAVADVHSAQVDIWGAQNNPTTGWDQRKVTLDGLNKMLGVAGDTTIGLFSGTSTSGNPDAIIKRQAAGVVQITNSVAVPGFVSAGSGFSSTSSNGLAPFTITSPWTNTFPRTMVAYIGGTTVTTTINGATVFSSLTGGQTVLVQTNEIVTFSGTGVSASAKPF